MISLLNFLYGSEPAEFRSSFTVQESVKRLSAATKRSFFDSFTKQCAVGSVKESKVRLQRVIPFLQNSYKPVFVGAFHSAGGRAVLRGRFGMHLFVKIFNTIWFGFCLLWTAMAGYAVLRNDADPKWLPLAGLVMFAFGLGLVALGKWLSRRDTEWISVVIRDALGSSET